MVATVTGASRGWARTFIRALLALVVLVVVAALIVSLFRIPVNLNEYRGVVETAASSALGRAVTIEGDVTVTTSLWPYFEIETLTIANPDGFESGGFARLERARVSVALLPLLLRKLHFIELEVAGLTLDLIRNSSGEANWALGGSTDSAAATADAEPGTGGRAR